MTIRTAFLLLGVFLFATLPAHAQGPGSSLLSRIEALETALANEVAARAAADTTLQTDIDTEAAARAAADTTLQTDIDTEAATRAAADGTLDTRLDKLEGDITSADLAGTYTLVAIQTRLAGTPDTRVGSAVLAGTMTLNPNGTGTLQINGDGAQLRFNGVLSQSTLGNGPPPGDLWDITWTYANGMLNFTVDGPPPATGSGGMEVGLGGRLLFWPLHEFRDADSGVGVHLISDVQLAIFFRLQ